MQNRTLRKKLIEGLETRKKQLEAEPLNLQYKIHNGHHLRDIITVLAFLNGSEDIENLINNLPEKKDLPKGA